MDRTNGILDERNSARNYLLVADAASVRNVAKCGTGGTPCVFEGRGEHTPITPFEDSGRATQPQTLIWLTP